MFEVLKKNEEIKFKDLNNLIDSHNNWMNQTINLIASENKLSPLAEKALVSDFGNRVAEGWIGERIFPGIKYYDEIEERGIALTKKMFNCQFADLRPISGTHANMIIFTAFTKPGDKIISFSIKNGAHISMSGGTPKNMFNLEVLHFPVLEDGFTIDVEKSIDLIRKEKPKLVIFGGSVLLFYQDIKEIVKVCKELNIITLFDASHIAGLIGTGNYPNPLNEGVDIMTFSTCKTIPGPQHAFIVANNYGDIIKKTTFPSTVSGHHLHETVAAIATLMELEEFGSPYIKKVLKNAKRLGSQLQKSGIDILFEDKGFTETHMILMKNNSNFQTNELEKRFEDANLIFNRNILPSDKSFRNPSGFRIGTPEVTRIGMEEEHMDFISAKIKEVYFNEKPIPQIKKEIIEFRKQFNKIKYCFSL